MRTIVFLQPLNATLEGPHVAKGLDAQPPIVCYDFSLEVTLSACFQSRYG